MRGQLLDTALRATWLAVPGGRIDAGIDTKRNQCIRVSEGRHHEGKRLCRSERNCSNRDKTAAVNFHPVKVTRTQKRVRVVVRRGVSNGHPTPENKSASEIRPPSSPYWVGWHSKHSEGMKRHAVAFPKRAGLIADRLASLVGGKALKTIVAGSNSEGIHYSST